MTRARPVHRLSKAEAALSAAISLPRECHELRRARGLKQAIEAYWRERGCRVDVTLLPVSVREGHLAQQRFVFALVSNTLNGWPLGDTA